MGMMRDREADLSGLRLLLSRLTDPVRRAEFSPEEWNASLSAWALELAGADTFPPEWVDIYAEYSHFVAQDSRARTLSRLAAFVSSRRGNGWQSLLLFLLGESECPALAARAATLAATLAPSDTEHKFRGVEAVVRLLMDRESTPPAVLNGILATVDRRLLPLLTPLHQLPVPRLSSLLFALEGSLNSLASDWLLPLADQPDLTEPLTLALLRLAASTQLVADLVYPIPSWSFKNPSPQPLHAWSLPDFFPRILPQLSDHLGESQILRLKEAFLRTPNDA